MPNIALVNLPGDLLSRHPKLYDLISCGISGLKNMATHGSFIAIIGLSQYFEFCDEIRSRLP